MRWTKAPKPRKPKEFDKVFLDVVDEGLRQVFGEAATDTILLHLERNNGLKKEEIPHNVEAFSSGLAELLVSGAPHMEVLLTRMLYSELQMEYDAKPGLSLTSHVQRLKKRFAG